MSDELIWGLDRHAVVPKPQAWIKRVDGGTSLLAEVPDYYLRLLGTLWTELLLQEARHQREIRDARVQVRTHPGDPPRAPYPQEIDQKADVIDCDEGLYVCTKCWRASSAPKVVFCSCLSPAILSITREQLEAWPG